MYLFKINYWPCQSQAHTLPLYACSQRLCPHHSAWSPFASLLLIFWPCPSAPAWTSEYDWASGRLRKPNPRKGNRDPEARVITPQKMKNNQSYHELLVTPMVPKTGIRASSLRVIVPLTLVNPFISCFFSRNSVFEKMIKTQRSHVTPWYRVNIK